mmetsp:Transcript_36784/g.61108  ORF Transcript_36784/g.61108 Transcript_36784/m.61108 type:complete len:147 (-) Transcript_36784:120-560(-)
MHPVVQLKVMYITHAKRFPTYGATYFPVQMSAVVSPGAPVGRIDANPTRVLLGVNADGIHVVSTNESRELIGSIPFKDIQGWTYSAEAFAILVSRDHPLSAPLAALPQGTTTHRFAFVTTEGNDIFELVQLHARVQIQRPVKSAAS